MKLKFLIESLNDTIFQLLLEGFLDKFDNDDLGNEEKYDAITCLRYTHDILAQYSATYSKQLLKLILELLDDYQEGENLKITSEINGLAKKVEEEGNREEEVFKNLAQIVEYIEILIGKDKTEDFISSFRFHFPELSKYLRCKFHNSDDECYDGYSR